MTTVTQPWVNNLPFMQQTVLLSGVRGCDGIPKLHKIKPLVRWYRRCVLYSAFEKAVIEDPFAPGGGSFTGPVADISEAVDLSLSYATYPPQHKKLEGSALYNWRCARMQKTADDFLDSRDELHHHYYTHMMHAFEIVGYKHPSEDIRWYFNNIYQRMAKAYHLWPETEEQMDKRLGDNQEDWLARSDESLSCSD